MTSSSGKLGLQKARDTPTGAWVSGLSLVVLAWREGKRRIPPAFLPYFEESRLARLGWAKAAGLRRGCSLTPGTRRSGSMPTAGLLPRGSGPTVCWRVFSAGGMGNPLGEDGEREIYRFRRAIEGIFRGLQRELGWTGHRHWRRARLLAHLALGWVAYGRIERQREGLGLSFYQCRRRLIAGKLSLDLSPLLPVQVEAA